jgi:hypothetical protein
MDRAMRPHPTLPPGEWGHALHIQPTQGRRKGEGAGAHAPAPSPLFPPLSGPHLIQIRKNNNLTQGQQSEQ